jgi:hypothetical protein
VETQATETDWQDIYWLSSRVFDAPIIGLYRQELAGPPGS